MSWLTASGVALLAAVLAFSGGSGAALPGTLVLHAPYSGSLSSPQIYGSVGGCHASAMNPTHPHWAPATGAITMSGAVKASDCGVNTGSSADISNTVIVVIPIPISANGTHLVKVKWTYNASLTKSMKGDSHCPSPVLNAQGYGSSYCSAFASSGLSGYLYFEDLTNLTYFYATNYWSGIANGSSATSSESCYSGTCTFSNSTSNTYGGLGAHGFTWWSNVTASKGDRVILVFQLSGYANVYAYGYPRAAASAAFNLGTLGNISHLVAVQIS